MSGGFMRHLKTTTRVLLYVLVFTLPLWVLSIPLEPLEFNKQTLFVGLTCLAALTWIGSMVMQKRTTLRGGWINGLPLLWIAAFLVPAFYSIAPYVSWFGGERQEYTSVLTALAAALLFYLLANTHESRTQHRHMHTVMLGSTVVLGLIAVIDVLGGNILSQVSAGLASNTIGTLTSFTGFLVVMNTFFLASWLSHKKGDSLMNDGVSGSFELLGTMIVCALTAIFLLILDDAQLWGLALISMATLFVATVFKASHIPNKGRLVLPGIFIAMSLVCWLWLPGLNVEIPLEVTPSTQTSASIAEATLQTYSSSYGSGPGTYLIDYAQFHPASLNETDFWDTHFDRASNMFYTLLPTLGVFGVTALGVFVLLLGARALVQMLRPQSRNEWLESFVYLAPWVTLVASVFLINWNMSLVGLFAILSGLLASQTLDLEKQKQVKQHAAISFLLSLALVVLSLVVLIGIFLTAQRYMAQMAFMRAVELDRGGAAMEEIVLELDRAATLNKYNDTYYRNLAEALMYRLDELIVGVQNIDTLSIESKQYLQSLAAAAVNAAATATEVSPDQVQNWTSRGFVYRELVPVMGQDAALLAIESYTRATELEPVNPTHWVELAKVQLVMVEVLQPFAQEASVQEQVQTLLNSAETNLLRSIELKNNYAPAHFQLAVVYARSGRLNDAIGKMESVATYNQLDIGVHFELAMLYLQRLGEGDLERARDALEHTVTLAPTHSNAHWFLASVHEQLGNIPAAVHEVEVVLELNPENELVMQRLQDLLTGNISTELHTTLE